jgi:hypothetical protein|nr:MAG TPA: hypothetical protein [Caudoviricetes sp.]
MTGSESRKAQDLFFGIIDYYANLSGTDITEDQLKQRDEIIKSGSIECDDSLDSEILDLQDQFLAKKESNIINKDQIAIVEKALSLLKKS